MKTQWGVYFVVVLLGLAVPGFGAEDRAEFQYNFRALDVRDVAKFHEELTQRPVEIDKQVDLRLTIAFSTTKPLTKAEAIAALEAALLRQLQLEIVPVDKTKSILQRVTVKFKSG